MRRSMRIRRRWATTLLRRIGVRARVVGTPPDSPGFFVSNHRSYLDPILLLRDLDAYPVAKAELANWPLIGSGAKMAGILYLKRESAGSRSGTLRVMSEKISKGFSILIFPEGTTSALLHTLPFKSGAFKLAATLGVPVVPVALIFEDSSDFWVGKTTFLAHAMRRFGAANIKVEIHYGPSLQMTDPQALLQASKRWIDDKIAINQRQTP